MLMVLRSHFASLNVIFRGYMNILAQTNHDGLIPGQLLVEPPSESKLPNLIEVFTRTSKVANCLPNFEGLMSEALVHASFPMLS